MALRVGEPAGSGACGSTDDGGIAAWALRTGRGTILWIDERLVTSKADRNYVEVWYRLNAIVRRQVFAYLPASRLGRLDLANRVFEPLDVSA